MITRSGWIKTLCGYWTNTPAEIKDARKQAADQAIKDQLIDDYISDYDKKYGDQFDWPE